MFSRYHLWIAVASAALVACSTLSSALAVQSIIRGEEADTESTSATEREFFSGRHVGVSRPGRGKHRSTSREVTDRHPAKSTHDCVASTSQKSIRHTAAAEQLSKNGCGAFLRL
jgi:hypothetical protein